MSISGISRSIPQNIFTALQKTPTAQTSVVSVDSDHDGDVDGAGGGDTDHKLDIKA